MPTRLFAWEQKTSIEGLAMPTKRKVNRLSPFPVLHLDVSSPSHSLSTFWKAHSQPLQIKTQTWSLRAVCICTSNWERTLLLIISIIIVHGLWFPPVLLFPLLLRIVQLRLSVQMQTALPGPTRKTSYLLKVLHVRGPCFAHLYWKEKCCISSNCCISYFLPIHFVMCRQ